MEYLYGLVIIVGLYVILATSFNLIIGYGGLVSIAHPVFFALGAYASAVLSRDFAVPVPLAMVAGALVLHTDRRDAHAAEAELDLERARDRVTVLEIDEIDRGTLR